mmetsp:Transcript_15125/g.49334  ORF Transcript_15125/g.49334 Transcript_15125/m.49334 type:complete len:338 (+) Transcript_15125:279-1292(+)
MNYGEERLAPSSTRHPPWPLAGTPSRLLGYGYPRPHAASWQSMPRPFRHLLLLVGGDVELEEDDIALLHDVVLPFLPVFARLFNRSLRSVLHKVLVVINLGFDESTLKVRVDGACRLGCSPAVADRPALYLIWAARVEMDQRQRVVAFRDDLAHLRRRLVLLAVGLLFFLVHCKELGLHTRRVRDHPLAWPLLIDPGLELREPLVLLPQEVRLAHVDEVDARLPGQQVVLVEELNLLGTPLAEADVLLLLSQPRVDFLRHLQPVLLLLGLAIARHLLLQRVQQLLDHGDVFEAELIGNDLQVANWVHISLDVRARIPVHGFFEHAAYVEDSICCIDV